MYLLVPLFFARLFDASFAVTPLYRFSKRFNSRSDIFCLTPSDWWRTRTYPPMQVRKKRRIKTSVTCALTAGYVSHRALTAGYVGHLRADCRLRQSPCADCRLRRSPCADCRLRRSPCADCRLRQSPCADCRLRRSPCADCRLRQSPCADCRLRQSPCADCRLRQSPCADHLVHSVWFMFIYIFVLRWKINSRNKKRNWYQNE